MKVVLCVGDQQTFSRMWHIKLSDPVKYTWVVPCSGDFHYQFHVASGVNCLAYAPLLQWFVNEADMYKTIKDKMNDTIHIKHIDHFYQHAIKSILTYLTDVYGHEYMAKKPSVLLEENETHQGERGGGGGGRGRAASPRQYNPLCSSRFLSVTRILLEWRYKKDSPIPPVV